MIRVGILARKSTGEQATSIERQIADGRLFAARQGWTVVESALFYVPEGVSGAVTNRPEFKALLEAGEKRLIEAVILQTNDRLTRGMIETVTMVVALRDAGIRTYSYTTGEEYRADSPMDRLMLAIKGSVAEMEREHIIARTSQAAFYRARLGFVAGNRLYGYDNVPAELGGATFRIRCPNEAEAKWVVWIHERYDEGWGLRRISAELNRLGVAPPRGGRKGPQEWGSTSVREVLRNASYAGQIVFGARRRVIRNGKKVVIKTPERVEITEAPHLRLLDLDLWERNKARFASTAHGARHTGNQPRGLLTGNFRCGECGGRMYVSGGRDKVYGCGARHQRGTTACSNGTKRPVDSTDSAVVDAVLRSLNGPALVEATLKAYRARAESTPEVDPGEPLRQREVVLQREIDNLSRGIAKATSDAVLTRLLGMLDEKEAELSTLTAALARAPVSLRVVDPAALRAQITARVNSLADVLRQDVAGSRDALRELLQEPAKATAIRVNGSPKFLIQASLSHGAMCAEFSAFKSGGDPNGI